MGPHGPIWAPTRTGPQPGLGPDPARPLAKSWTPGQPLAKPGQVWTVLDRTGFGQTNNTFSREKATGQVLDSHWTGPGLLDSHWTGLDLDFMVRFARVGSRNDFLT